MLAVNPEVWKYQNAYSGPPKEIVPKSARESKLMIEPSLYNETSVQRVPSCGIELNTEIGTSLLNEPWQLLALEPLVIPDIN